MRKLSWFVLLLLCACSTLKPTEIVEEQPVKIRYLALGDSYTIGESVDEAERWPNQLADFLKAGGIPTDVTIIARTGWTTQELWDGIQAQQIDPPYDLVSLLIGVNNQYRGYDIKEYREQFAFLLNKSIEYAGGNPKHVIILSIPDWGVTPFARGQGGERIAREIDAFNAVNRDETKKAGAYYVDVTAISREAAHDSALVAGDGLHPSGKMYLEWAKLAYLAALKTLEISK
jgi:lysophospholipase L1-like esterase